MKTNMGYPAEERRLKLRLNELLERRDELEREGSFSCEYIISDHDIDFTLPEHLTCVHDVDLAIEMTYYKLFGEYELVHRICSSTLDRQKNGFCQVLAYSRQMHANGENDFGFEVIAA